MNIPIDTDLAVQAFRDALQRIKMLQLEQRSIGQEIHILNTAKGRGVEWKRKHEALHQELGRVKEEIDRLGELRKTLRGVVVSVEAQTSTDRRAVCWR